VAPEFLNYRVVSYKSDIYSLGVVMTEILNGQKGYFPNDENVRIIRPNSVSLR
jgi:serine/threonine protein kinase